MILDFFTKLHNDTEAPKAESFIAVSKAQNVILVEGLPFEIPSENILKFDLWIIVTLLHALLCANLSLKQN